MRCREAVCTSIFEKTQLRQIASRPVNRVRHILPVVGIRSVGQRRGAMSGSGGYIEKWKFCCCVVYEIQLWYVYPLSTRNARNSSSEFSLRRNFSLTQSHRRRMFAELMPRTCFSSGV